MLWPASRSVASFASRSARRRAVLVTSAARASADRAAVSRDGVFILECPLRRRGDIVYFHPFRASIWPRRTIGVRWPATGGASARDATAPRSSFGCFGFFASRFDRLCPFAIAGSFSPRGLRASNGRLDFPGAVHSNSLRRKLSLQR